MTDGAHLEIELGEGEDDAFIPNGNSVSRHKKQPPGNLLVKFFVLPIQAFFKTLSTIKLVLLLLLTFLVLLGLLTYWNKRSSRFVGITIPSDSAFLMSKLVKSLSGTAIPAYVLTYAPLVFLDKGDRYLPSDLETHISSTYPAVNFTQVNGTWENLTLNNLDILNKFGGEDVYLTSIPPLMEMPSWIFGQKPNPNTLQTENAVSCVVIVVDKGEGVVDAFYMYFYSFNDGPSALGHQAGNHLGDWEHNMVRFKHGLPQAVWFSQHEYGEAITYSAVHKVGRRPVSFSARGSHANYLTGDAHDLAKEHSEIPSHIVYDRTSQGLVWDPTLSAYYYTYSTSTTAFTPAVANTPTGYLYFQGRWGDQQYPDEVKGQEEFHGFRKWTDGPQGPLFKFLDRENVCWTAERECIVQTVIE